MEGLLPAPRHFATVTGSWAGAGRRGPDQADGSGSLVERQLRRGTWIVAASEEDETDGERSGYWAAFGALRFASWQWKSGCSLW